MAELVLREVVGVGYRRAQYKQEWYCEVPPQGSSYRVLHDEWLYENGADVRRIYEVAVIPLKVVAHSG